MTEDLSVASLGRATLVRQSGCAADPPAHEMPDQPALMKICAMPCGMPLSLQAHIASVERNHGQGREGDQADYRPVYRIQIMPVHRAPPSWAPCRSGVDEQTGRAP